MRILLISVTGRLPMDGSRLVSALLKEAGHRVVNVYLARRRPDYGEREFRALDELLRRSDLVMVAVYSSYAARAAALTDYVHRFHPGRLVVWGGPHCIAAPRICLRHADAVCFCEGDEAVPEFVARLERGADFTTTPNMAFRAEGGVRVNPVLPPFDALDRLPFCDYGFADHLLLDRDLLPIDAARMREMMRQYPFYLPALYFLTARGCPHQCSYCNNHRFVTLFGRNRIRFHSPDRVVDELGAIVSRLGFVEFIGFGDDDFMARDEAQIEHLAGRFRREIGLPFGVAASANTFHPRKFEILMDHGMVAFNMGIQSGSRRVLREVYHRPISLARTRAIAQHVAPHQRAGRLAVILDFIIDNPYETPEDVLETFRYLRDLPRGVKPNLFFLSFFPGTPLFDRALRDGHIASGDASHHRSFTRSRIRYQKNYETFLVLLARWARFDPRLSKLPRWVLTLLAAGPLRRLAGRLPASFWERWINRLVIPQAQRRRDPSPR